MITITEDCIKNIWIDSIQYIYNVCIRNYQCIISKVFNNNFTNISEINKYLK